MGSIVNRPTYQRLLLEDLEWLLQQPRTLERDHIAHILNYEIQHDTQRIFALQQERSRLERKEPQ